MKADFKASASKDVQELGTALSGLKEHNERLEMHKRLLLGQVSHDMQKEVRSG
jgi:hypothetical protein